MTVPLARLVGRQSCPWKLFQFNEDFDEDQRGGEGAGKRLRVYFQPATMPNTPSLLGLGVLRAKQKLRSGCTVSPTLDKAHTPPTTGLAPLQEWPDRKIWERKRERDNHQGSGRAAWMNAHTAEASGRRVPGAEGGVEPRASNRFIPGPSTSGS